MNFLLDLTQPLVLALILFIALLVASLTVVGRPWRSSRSELADRLRIGSAVVRYDFWLEMHGVSRRRRRGLREELRTNLDDAAEQVGAAEAVKALGSLRQMAASTATGPPSGPRWSSGANAAAVVLLVGFLAELLAIISWAGAADASGVGRVEGSLPLFPGSLAIWEHTGDSLSISLDPGWLVIAAVAIAFLIGSRPWLVGSRRRRANSPAA